MKCAIDFNVLSIDLYFFFLFFKLHQDVFNSLYTKNGSSSKCRLTKNKIQKTIFENKEEINLDLDIATCLSFVLLYTASTYIQFGEILWKNLFCTCRFFLLLLLLLLLLITFSHIVVFHF